MITCNGRFLKIRKGKSKLYNIQWYLKYLGKYTKLAVASILRHSKKKAKHIYCIYELEDLSRDRSASKKCLVNQNLTVEAHKYNDLTY